MGVLAPAWHGGGDVIEILERTRRRFLARSVGGIIGIGKLGRQPGNLRRFPQKLETRVELLEVLIRARMRESRIDIVDESVAAGIINRQTRRQLILDERTRKRK